MLCGWRILRNVCPMPVLLTRGPVYLKYDLGEPGTLFVYTDILLYYPKKNTKAINNVDKVYIQCAGKSCSKPGKGNFISEVLKSVCRTH